MVFACFWVDETDEVELHLRRMILDEDRQRANPCPSGYHEASVSVGRAPARRNPDRTHSIDSWDPDEFAGDARWPARCQWCNAYEFADDDYRQVLPLRIFRRADTGEEYNDRKLPPGAMLDGHWHPQKGPDGIALVVVLPPPSEDTRGHWWHVDGPARKNGIATGGGWKRTGDPKAQPPTVAAQPSIDTGTYHGYLELSPTGSTQLSDHLGS